MLRSLYSGISGMKVNQVKLDVLGNNVANVGTTSFKSSRARFQDMLSQNVSAALAPALNQGGINPSRVGLGVKLAGIDTLVSQGNMQPTSRNLDMAVDGDGYFMVYKGPVVFEDGTINIDEDNSLGDITEGEVSFTRDGSFTLDADGNLLTSDGYRVLGYSVSGSIEDDGDIAYVDANSDTLTASEDLRTLRIPDKIVDGTDELRIISFTVDKDGLVKAVCEGGKVSALGQISMASFKNAAGLEKSGSNLYKNTANSGEPIIRTGVGTPVDEANGKGYGDILQGMLEMSNVDLAEQFTEMIVTSRAFQASGKMITTGDEILQDIINLKR